MACPICGSARVIPFRRVKQTPIFRCRECTVQFCEPGDAEAVRGIYGREYFVGEESGAGYEDYFRLEAGLRRGFARRVERMKQADPGARTCLEVGSGPGFFLDEARKAGLDAMGVEISDYAGQWGRENLSVSIQTGTLNDVQAEPGSRDMACMWDVLEHLPNPVESLKRIAEILKPGGSLWISTGDVGSLAAKMSGARWHLYTIPEHLFFFNRRSMEEALRRSGFRMERLFHDSTPVPLAYVEERLRKTLGVRIPFLRGAKMVLPVNLFDVMTVCARRG